MDFPEKFLQYRSMAKENCLLKIIEDATQHKIRCIPFFVPTMTQAYNEVGCGMKLVTLGVSHCFWTFGIWDTSFGMMKQWHLEI